LAKLLLIPKGAKNIKLNNRDGILGYQFDKRLESSAPSYSKPRLYSGFKNTYKKSANQKKL
jgi:hypothetical protein